ncbi:MAG: hypothetical protein M3N19_03450 [Candidatus Eremiobacteraeota bacterium]|nr:hypothetical protein [Candidatus Eremiobacteraeota bacterium]
MNIRPLEKASRRMMMVCSASLCVASVLLAPLTARSIGSVHAQGELATHKVEAPPLSDVMAPIRVVVRRDPFSADVLTPDIREGHSEAMPAANALIGTRVQAGSLTGITLPGLAVSAIVTGDHPQALVIEGDHSRILSVGDFLDGHKIRAITKHGLVLDDGSARLLAEGRL